MWILLVSRGEEYLLHLNMCAALVLNCSLLHSGMYSSLRAFGAVNSMTDRFCIASQGMGQVMKQRKRL